MDSRAGGATEAEEAGVDAALIQEALTHSQARTTVRYIRRRSEKIAGVAEARNAKRATEHASGTLSERAVRTTSERPDEK